MSTIKKFSEVLVTIISCLTAFFITRFDNFGPGMLSIFNRECSRTEKKKIISYTIKNLIVFGIMSQMSNSILSLKEIDKIGINLFFCAIGLAVFIFTQYEMKEKKISKIFKNLIKCVNITLRVGCFVKAIMVIICLTVKIPIIGPLFWTFFVLINLPKVLKEELKRFL